MVPCHEFFLSPSDIWGRIHNFRLPWVIKTELARLTAPLSLTQTKFGSQGRGVGSRAWFLFILSTALAYCIWLAGKRLLVPLPSLASLCGEVQEGQGSMMAVLCSQHLITSSYYGNEMFFRNWCLMPCHNTIYSWIFIQVQVNRLIWHVV